MTGILGALLLILGLIGLGTLPLNVGGLLLIVLRAGAVRTRAHRHQPRAASIRGLVCFALGASALFTGPIDPFEPLARVAPAVIVVIDRDVRRDRSRLMAFGASARGASASARWSATGVALGHDGRGSLAAEPARLGLSPAGEEWTRQDRRRHVARPRNARPGHQG